VILKQWSVWLYLSTRDGFIVDDEPVVDRGGQLQSLDPETHMTLLQNLIVQLCLQWNSWKKKRKNTKSFLDNQNPHEMAITDHEQSTGNSLGCLML